MIREYFKTGFTLLELIVAMALIGIMTLVGIANFRGATRTETVESATERVRQMFVQAKANAAAGKKDCSICGAGDGVCRATDVQLQGWEVTVNNTVDPVTLTVQGLCGPGRYPTPPLPTPFLTKTETLPAGVTVTVLQGATTIGPTPIVFRPFGGGVVPEITDSTLYRFNIADSWGNTGTFTLDGSGEIQQ